MSELPYHVSILIAVHDEAELLLRCLAALARLDDDQRFEVVVVDDGSRDHTAAVLAAIDGDLQALYEDGIGWGPAIDRAAAVAGGEHLVLMRGDVVPADGWLEELLAPLEQDPDVGVVLPMTVTATGSVLGWDRWACVALRREAFEAVGGVAGASRPGRAEKASLLAALDAAGWAARETPSAVVLALADFVALD
jgi:glycosyltransferase involved in cell wall biosynthesis